MSLPQLMRYDNARIYNLFCQKNLRINNLLNDEARKTFLHQQCI